MKRKRESPKKIFKTEINDVDGYYIFNEPKMIIYEKKPKINENSSENPSSDLSGDQHNIEVIPPIFGYEKLVNFQKRELIPMNNTPKLAKKKKSVETQTFHQENKREEEILPQRSESEFTSDFDELKERNKTEEYNLLKEKYEKIQKMKKREILLGKGLDKMLKTSFLRGNEFYDF